MYIVDFNKEPRERENSSFVYIYNLHIEFMSQ